MQSTGRHPDTSTGESRVTDHEYPASDLPAESPDDLVVAIETLSDDEAAAAIMALARRPGSATIPALQRLALSGRPKLVEAALSALGQIGRAEAASALAALSEQLVAKEQRKLARRLLHRLTAQGVRPVSVPAAPTRAAGVRATYRPYAGLASTIYGEGARIIHAAFVEPAGGVLLLSAHTSDERGIVDFTARHLGRRRFEEEREAVLKGSWPIFVELPAEYARFLLYERLNQASREHLPLPLDVGPWFSFIMEGQPTYQRPLIYEYLDAAEVRWNPAYLDESPALLELAELAGWQLDPEQVAPFDPDAEAQRARIVLPEHTRREQGVSAVQRAVAALFTAPVRERWRRRLEEVAYILLQRGSERNARRALAAALALDETAEHPVLGAPRPVHPFLAALVEQAFERRRQEAVQLVRQGRLWLPRSAE